ncbi:MAG TPA: hypothetical protein VMT43_07535, partial [Acidimicrobiales bacterium]|nr:hypothetical protein [Acidimicrobiales bacterium]
MHDQIATSRRLHVVGAVHTSVPVVDLSSRRARMQIQYALTDGHLTVTYVNEVVLLWRGPVAVTLYLDRQGGPMV